MLLIETQRAKSFGKYRIIKTDKKTGGWCNTNQFKQLV